LQLSVALGLPSAGEELLGGAETGECLVGTRADPGVQVGGPLEVAGGDGSGGLQPWGVGALTSGHKHKQLSSSSSASRTTASSPDQSGAS
jgi:hypothetical protein